MKHLTRGKDYLAQFPDFRLIGRDEELTRLVSILVRNHASSVILTGARGVGCESLCKGVQWMKTDPSAPFDIVGKRLFWLDINGLFSSGDAAQMNASFQKIIDRIHHTSNAILIIEDTRDFLNAARSSGCGHFINSIISEVQGKTGQFILIVRDDDLEMVLKTHGDFRELFTIENIDEPGGEALRAIVDDAAAALSRHHGIRISPEAVTTAIALTTKYRTRDAGLSSAQPDRSVTLLDRSFASYRILAHTRPPTSISADKWADYQKQIATCYQDQRDGEDAIVELEEEIERAQTSQMADASGSSEGAAFERMTAPNGMDSKPIADKRRRIAEYKRLVDENKRTFAAITAKLNESLVLNQDDVVREFSDISGIDANKLTQNDLDKLKSLDTSLKKRIYGQDRVVEKLANAVKVARVGRRGGGEPQAAFLFLGPSGVGKTEIAKALAAILLDDERALTRFDMSEYMEKHAVAKLIGAPPGYEGFEAGGQLTNLMRKNGNRVILFDEIEKAHPDVYNIFLQILSDGRLTDNVGRTVSFEDAIVLMTTNIGQPHFLDASVSFEEAEREALADLAAAYRSELLNRFAGRQNIICFNRLELDSIRKIVAREIGKLDEAYRDRGLRVSIDPDSLVAFCEALYDPTIGARGLPGYIRANIEPVIVNGLINNPEVGGHLVIRFDGKLSVELTI